jgi:hypothetical protein
LFFERERNSETTNLFLIVCLSRLWKVRDPCTFFAGWRLKKGLKRILLFRPLFVSFLKPSCYITFVFVAILKFASLWWLLNCAKKMFECHTKFSKLMPLKLFFVVELKTFFTFIEIVKFIAEYLKSKLIRTFKDEFFIKYSFLFVNFLNNKQFPFISSI